MAEILLVAATERELDGSDGLVCGVGPVEAAAATGRALALGGVGAVLHVGVAGGRGLVPGSLVIGVEALYCDLSAAFPVVDRVAADPRLVAAAQAAVPTAVILPIGTSAAVAGVDDDVPVEAMEGFGVLRAAQLAGVPAVEVRAISNEIGEADRGKWQIGAAIAMLSSVIPALLGQIESTLRV